MGPAGGLTLTTFDFLSGAVTFGFLLAFIFFLRFWKQTGDLLFLGFASAFALLGVGQAIQCLADMPEEHRSYIYLFRLAAFSIIIFAIMKKNRSKT